MKTMTLVLLAAFTLATFFLEMGAWALPALSALALPYWKHHITLKRTYLITFCWAAGSLVLLSLMPEKKMRYLLPSLAPCAMLVACVMTHLKDAYAMGHVDTLRDRPYFFFVFFAFSINCCRFANAD